MTYDPAKNSAGSYDEAVSELRWRKECESIPAKRVEHIGACTLFLEDCLWRGVSYENVAQQQLDRHHGGGGMTHRTPERETER